jgi:predicted TIM-barrel fold metal-dependent hydrolase
MYTVLGEQPFNWRGEIVKSYGRFPPRLRAESREEIIADFRTFYYETALSGFETNLVALENFVEPDHILFGTDFPAVSPQTAGWYTNNVDA